MSSLEVKKKELELARVRIARQELEFKVDERLEDIERLRGHIQVQLDTELRIEEELKQIKK